MTLPGLMLSLALAQNAILVHFLGVRPMPAVLASPRRALIVSAGTTVALVWVSTVVSLIGALLPQALFRWYLHTPVVALVIGVSVLGGMRLASLAAPFHRRTVVELVPTVLVNTSVFVIAMGLTRSELSVGWVAAGAFAAGVGLVITMVPLAWIVRHLSHARIPRALRGDASVYLVLAFAALVVQSLDQLLARIFVPVF